MASNPVTGRVSIWPALIFILWTCLGVVAFVMQATADLAEVRKGDAYQAQIWEAMPIWAWVAYGLAVGAGLAGALGLLARRKLSVPLSAICLVAVLVQFSYTFFLTDLIAVRGWTTVLFPAVIIAMAAAQLLYARSLGAKGVLR